MMIRFRNYDLINRELQEIYQFIFDQILPFENWFTMISTTVCHGMLTKQRFHWSVWPSVIWVFRPDSTDAFVVFATKSFTAEADLQANTFIYSDLQANTCICLKIGLGRETFSCENHKSVRWILWKALQSGPSTISLGELLHCVLSFSMQAMVK